MQPELLWVNRKLKEDELIKDFGPDDPNIGSDEMEMLFLHELEDDGLPNDVDDMGLANVFDVVSR